MTVLLVLWVASGAYAAGLATRDPGAVAQYQERREAWGRLRNGLFYVFFVPMVFIVFGPFNVIGKLLFPPEHPRDLCVRCWLRPKRGGAYVLCKRCADEKDPATSTGASRGGPPLSEALHGPAELRPVVLPPHSVSRKK